MAALMNSYQPEGISFSPRYPDGVTRSFEADIEEVKSKPRAKANSYIPLVNESTHREERQERYRREALTRTTSQMYKQKSSDSGNQCGMSTSCPQELSWNQCPLSDNDLSKSPTRLDVHSLATRTALNNGNGSEKGVHLDYNDGDDDLVKVDLGAPSLAVSESDVTTSQTESENEQECMMDDCKAALLGDYQPRGRNGSRRSRPSSISLGLPRDILCSPGGLVEVLYVGHKKCTVSLEDECISWQILSRKSGESGSHVG